MTPNTRSLTISIAAWLLLIGPGLVMVAGLGFPGLLRPVEMFLDFAILPLDGADIIEGASARLLNAILGGVLVGFGILIWRVVREVYEPYPDLGKRLLVTAILGWFVCDSLGSILAGAPFNAALNILILACLVAPLFWPAQPELA